MSIGTRGLDTIIVFFVRSTIVAFKRLRSGWWVPTEAHVTKAAWHRAFIGCDTAAVQYKYSVEGQEYRNTSVQPFFDGGDPDGPVRMLPPGTTTQIRYDPKNPSSSFLVERWWITRRGMKV